MTVELELNAEDHLQLYRQMLLIRTFEETCAEQYVKGKITGFTHLYSGQEAVAVGAMSAISDKDYVVTAYRDHGHALAKGASPQQVMSELFGKSTGLSSGKGGSMHLFHAGLHFMGGYAIVGGGLPITVWGSDWPSSIETKQRLFFPSAAMVLLTRVCFTSP